MYSKPSIIVFRQFLVFHYEQQYVTVLRQTFEFRPQIIEVVYSIYVCAMTNVARRSVRVMHTVMRPYRVMR